MSAPPHPALCFPARFSSLPELQALLSSRITLAPLDPQAARSTLLRAQTVVEELFANSIHHGYGGESDQPVWLDARLEGATVHVLYADRAPGYNPLAGLEHATPVINDQGEASRIGGAGRRLIDGLTDRCSYRRQDDRNELTMEFSLRP